MNIKKIKERIEILNQVLTVPPQGRSSISDERELRQEREILFMILKYS